MPAAALRGLAKSFSPLASAWAFKAAKSAFIMYTSPRSSNRAGVRAGGNASTGGSSLMVFTFAVTSSPTVPSPRVEAWTSTPRS